MKTKITVEGCPYEDKAELDTFYHARKNALIVGLTDDLLFRPNRRDFGYEDQELNRLLAQCGDVVDSNGDIRNVGSLIIERLDAIYRDLRED